MAGVSPPFPGDFDSLECLVGFGWRNALFHQLVPAALKLSRRDTIAVKNFTMRRNEFRVLVRCMSGLKPAKDGRSKLFNSDKANAFAF